MPERRTVGFAGGAGVKTFFTSFLSLGLSRLNGLRRIKSPKSTPPRGDGIGTTALGFCSALGTPSAADPEGCATAGTGTAGGVAGAVLFWSAAGLVPLDSLEGSTTGDALGGS